MLGRKADVVWVAMRPSEREVLNKVFRKSRCAVCRSTTGKHLSKPLIRPSWPVLRKLWHIETLILHTYLAFRRPQWNPTDKTQNVLRCEMWVAFFPTWSLTQLPTHFLELHWFRILSWIRNFLATNGKGYDNSRLSDDTHRGSREILDKWLRFTCPSYT